ncbi:MAG: hypothetical protein AAF970_07060 [Bacteroidota bacterium]
MSWPSPTLLTGCVRAYRLGFRAQADDALVRFLGALHEALEAQPDAATPALARLLEELHAAHDRQDGLHLADLLAYRIAPLLPAPATG